MKKKIYICDCCGKTVDDPYKARMVMLDREIININPFERRNIKTTRRIDICHDCWSAIKNMSKLKD